MNTIKALVNDAESLTLTLDQMRAAQAELAHFTQEQVDRIFYAAAMAANKARIPLAQAAVAETGMGVVEDKVIKNHYAAEYVHNGYKDLRTCGVVERDAAGGFTRIAEPIGIVAAIIPTTNPTSTAIFKTLICLKTRNAVLISPHPRAARCTIEAARIMREAAEAAGLPQHVIGWIDEPSLELTTLLMQQSDTVLATGGPGMVKAAYSSGTPALGVGAGNNPAIIDDSADLPLAVSSIIHSKVFDHGMICATEQNVIVLDSVYERVKAEMRRRGCHFLDDAEAEAVGRTIITGTGGVNAKAVGQPPGRLAEMAGIEVPANAKVLVAEVESVEPSEPWAHEKLTTALGMYRAKNFEEALTKASRLIADGGYGHTASLFVDPAAQEKIDRYAAVTKTCRILVNTPAAQGGLGDLYNFRLNPSLTLGCGSWGGNSVSGNVGAAHLLNIKTVAERRENMLWVRVPEKVYFTQGCLTTALRELGSTLGKKRAFIITDEFLHHSGFTRPVERVLDEMGIAHTSFWSIEPDPTLASAEQGLAHLRAFEPDTIIAIGGGSAMDCAKIMWFMYEHPQESFEDMSMNFMDIRKRVYPFPSLGKECYFVAIPTTSGTGSEVTPFAVITHQETGAKWPVADYELLPDMAIIDTDNMMTQPKSLTSSSGVDALSHALESFVSVMASDFTDAWALQAMKLIFEHLPRAYAAPDDVTAREGMAHAATIAGFAFGNAFLGVNHSMAHKLGAWHHIPHGWANGVVLTRVMRYNAAERPTRMGTFPRYDHPKTLARYAQAGRFCGVPGSTDEEVFEGFVAKIEALLDEVGCHRTLADFGVEEDYFLAHLDEMTEQAFNDQCTAANPRYPLISELKELFLDTYYGREPSSYED